MTGSERESYACNRARVFNLNARAERIKQLNDHLRTKLEGGLVTITSGVRDIDPAVQQKLLEMIQSFAGFDDANDPHEEHDFGAVEHSGHHLFWKIDYYDKSLEYGSEDPADPDKTTRVLTIMLASEY